MLSKNIKNVIFVFSLILFLELDDVSKSKCAKDILESNNINKSIFSENDLKISDNPFQNEQINIESIKENNNNINNISSFKDTNSTTNPNIFQIKTKNSFMNNLSNSNILSNNQTKNYSSNISIKKENVIQGLNTSDYDIDMINYQDKNLQEQINHLKKENELLKKNIKENNENNKVSEELNHELMDLKHKLAEYDSSIEIIKSKYNNDIEKLKFQIREYNSYIHLTYLFFHNITNNALTSLNFNIEKQNYILISLEEFQQKLKQIEAFVYDILKENSNLKIKYHKLIDSNNNKLFNEIYEDENNKEKYTNISNIVNDSYNTSGSNFNGLIKSPENVFENNYENLNKNLEINHLNNRKNLNQGTLEIYKTLEQRVNILEKELNIQKNIQNNIYHNNPNIKVFHTVNSKNDTIIGRVRSKSGNKISNFKQNDNSEYSINDIPVIEKPKKNVKKKKKGTPGKVSIGSNKNDNNKNIRGSSKSINRSSTPIQNRKSTPTNSNVKIGNFGKFKKH